MPDEFGPLASLAAIYAWFVVFKTAYKVTILENHEIEIRTVLKKTILLPGGIESIEDSSLMLKLKTSKGKLYISTLMDDISGIKSALKSNSENAN